METRLWPVDRLNRPTDRCRPTDVDRPISTDRPMSTDRCRPTDRPTDFVRATDVERPISTGDSWRLCSACVACTLPLASLGRFLPGNPWEGLYKLASSRPNLKLACTLREATLQKQHCSYSRTHWHSLSSLLAVAPPTYITCGQPCLHAAKTVTWTSLGCTVDSRGSLSMNRPAVLHFPPMRASHAGDAMRSFPSCTYWHTISLAF